MLKWVLMLITLLGCSAPGTGPRQQVTEQKPEAQVALLPDVDTFQIKISTFEDRRVAVGTLEPSRKVVFRLADPLAPVEFRVHNGQVVKAGDTLAIQPQPGLWLALEKATLELAERRAAYLERLLGLGYSTEDSLSIPVAVRNQAAMSSGWLKAKVTHQEAKLALKQAAIIAPFPGVISGINLPEKEQDPAFALSLADLSSLLVTFQILPGEITFLKPGTAIRVNVAGVNRVFQAKVEEINPEVSAGGLVYVRARFAPAGEKLLPGMAAEVVLFRAVPGQVVVPTTALLHRQGRELVFVWKNDSAFWRYVTPGPQNAEWAIIRDGIQPGEIVISEGGFALANAVPVSVRQKDISTP